MHFFRSKRGPAYCATHINHKLDAAAGMEATRASRKAASNSSDCKKRRGKKQECGIVWQSQTASESDSFFNFLHMRQASVADTARVTAQFQPLPSGLSIRLLASAVVDVSVCRLQFSDFDDLQTCRAALLLILCWFLANAHHTKLSLNVSWEQMLGRDEN